MSTPSAPPLDMDLAIVDTSRPILKEAVLQCKVDKIEMAKTSPEKGEKRMLSIELSTMSPAYDRKTGQPVAPGHKLYDNIMIEPTGKLTWEQIGRGQLPQLVQSAQLPPGSCKLSNIDQWFGMLAGRPVKAEVGYEPAGSSNGKSYREKNVILSYQK